MLVDPISLLERHKYPYDPDNKRNSFPKWLAYMYSNYLNTKFYRIGLQLMWSELRRKEIQSKDVSEDNLRFAMNFEEKMWLLAATIDSYSVSNLQVDVLNELQLRIKQRKNQLTRKQREMYEVDEFTLHEFIDSFTFVFKRFCPWVSYSVI